MAAKTKAKLMEELIAEAEELGLTIPSDILLSHARKDLKAALDALKLHIKLKPSDLPLFTLKTPGAVPAPKDKGLVLYSEGWGKPAFAQQIYAGLGMNFPLSPPLGGTGIANAAGSTLTLGAATSITGGGTLALGGFTLTVPATGTAALGTGTAEYVARWTDANTLSTGIIRDNGVNVGINVAPNSQYATSIYNSSTLSSSPSVIGIFNNALHDNADALTKLNGIYSEVTWSGAGICLQAAGEHIKLSVEDNAPASGASGLYISATASATLFNSMRAIDIYGWGCKGVGHTLTNSYAIWIDPPFITGTIVNQYGIYISNISGASTLNYAIYTGAGAVRFGDTLTTVGVLTIPNNPVIGGFTVTVPITGTTAMGAGTLTSATTNDVTVAAHTHAITGSVGLAGNGTAQYQVLTTGANPYPAGWSDFYLRGTTGGTVNFAVTNTKTLTLTAADDYNLTIPATGTTALGTGTADMVARWSGTNTLTTGVLYDNGVTAGIGAGSLDANRKFQVVYNVNTDSGQSTASGYYWAIANTALVQPMAGLAGSVATYHTTGTVWSIFGLRFGIGKYAAGDVDVADGIYVTIDNLHADGILTWARRVHLIQGTNLGTTRINIGLYIDDLTYGSWNNYAIYTNKGINRLGDQLTITGWQDIQQLIVTGHTTQTTATPLVQYTRNDTAAGISAMLGLTTLGSGANNDGGSILLNGKSSTTAATFMGEMDWLYTDATHATRTTDLVFYNVCNTTKTEMIRLDGSAVAVSIPVDTFWTGDGSGLPFGSMSDAGTDLNWTQVNPVQNTWYDISDSDMADGEFNLVTHNGSGQLTVTNAGRYFVHWACGFEASVANKHLEFAISINGTENTHGKGRYETKAVSAEGWVSNSAILDLAASSTVNLSIRTTDAGNVTLTIHDIELQVFMLGGT